MTHIRAVIVADGDVDLDLLRTALTPGAGESVLAIGADGGTRHLDAVGRQPDLICGDADSLSADDLQRHRDRGTAVDLQASDKDESDAELSLRAAIDRGAVQAVMLGALGGARVEHGVANQLLLASPLVDRIELVILHAGAAMRRIGSVDKAGRASVVGQPGDYVSLLPLDDPVTGITTVGLRFPLADEPLPLGSTRGLSNELVDEKATISTRAGRLLVIHTPHGPLAAAPDESAP